MSEPEVANLGKSGAQGWEFRKSEAWNPEFREVGGLGSAVLASRVGLRRSMALATEDPISKIQGFSIEG